METNNKLSLLEVLNLQLFAEEDNNEDIEDDDKEEESLDENDFEEVGSEFNVTRERIRQIEAKALRKLRHPVRSNKFKDK